MNPILEITLRSCAVYIIVLLGLRVLGKRHISQLSLVDFVLILLISNAVQNAMVGNDTSLLGGIVAAVSLILLNFLLTLFLYKNRKAEHLFEGDPVLLIRHGKIIQRHLQQEKISSEELHRIIREHGFDNIAQIKTAILEVDGTISLMGLDTEEKRTKP